ncbi:MAG: hypothetical protein ACRC7O_00540 [Fimbriiglobus sp.]
MTGLLADHNVGAHVTRLVAVLVASEFAAEWMSRGLSVETFASLGLDIRTDDRALFALCQSRELILVTANRNHDGDDSLAAAIRDGGLDDLPVLTLARADRVLNNGQYAMAAAISLLEYVMDLEDRPETIRGAGRLYLPKRST